MCALGASWQEDSDKKGTGVLGAFHHQKHSNRAEDAAASLLFAFMSKPASCRSCKHNQLRASPARHCAHTHKNQALMREHEPKHLMKSTELLFLLRAQCNCCCVIFCVNADSAFTLLFSCFLSFGTIDLRLHTLCHLRRSYIKQSAHSGDGDCDFWLF